MCNFQVFKNKYPLEEIINNFRQAENFIPK